MKNASPALIAYLGSNRVVDFADLWTFSLVNGTVLRYTGWDRHLTISGNTFLSHDVILVGGKLKQTRGLDADETDLTCYPNLGAKPSMIGSIPFLQALRAGLMDNATVQRERLFMPSSGDTSLGTVRVFLGLVTEVDVTRNTASLKCKDPKYLLNIYMPRRQYMPKCAWTFGDSNCTFNKASLTVSSSVGAGSSSTSILCDLAQAAGYFNFGNVAMTSGINTGISRAVKSYSPGIVYLTGPFPLALSVGDTFDITPGCSKNLNAPTQQFNASASDGNSAMIIQNNVGNSAGDFNGAVLTFDSGVLNGQTATINQWQPNLAIMATPFTSKPAVGDSFTISGPTGSVGGQVTSPLSPTVIPLGLSNSDGFFNNATLQFTSGTNVGQVQTVSSWANGIATMATGFAYAIGVGDECTLTTAGTDTTATCTGYDNTINFAGAPYIPLPETAY